MTVYNIPAPALSVTGDRHVTATWETPAKQVAYSKRSKGTETSLAEYRDYVATAGGTDRKLMGGYTIEYWYKTQPSGTEWLFGQSIDVPRAGTTSAAFDAPDDALAVRVRVRPKAIRFTDWAYSSRKDAGGRRTYTWTSKSRPYFTEGVGYWREHVFAADAPSAPTVSVSTNVTATRATLTITATDADTVSFEVQPKRGGRNEGGVVQVAGTSYTYSIAPGSWYSFSVRAKTARGIVSAWVQTAAVWSSVAIPAVDKVAAASADEVECVLSRVANSGGYEVRYAKAKAELSEESCPSVSSASRTVRIGGLETGQRYWFMPRAKNNAGVWTDWGAAVAGVAGTTPDAPTLYIPTQVGKVNEYRDVSWTHNSTDGSEQTAAQVRVRSAAFDSEAFVTQTFDYTTQTTSRYYFSSPRRAYVSARTKGANGEWSTWSAEELVRWYPDATPSITVPEHIDGADIDVEVDVPIASTIATPVAYLIEIVSVDSYARETPGGAEYVGAGEVVWQGTYKASSNVLNASIATAPWAPVDGQGYFVRATATLSSGMEYGAVSAVATCRWGLYLSEPDALLYEAEDRAMVIQPRCREAVDVSADGEVTAWDWLACTLDVYRIASDGTATLIAEDVENGGTCHDGHPTFNRQRYRIAAKATATGETRWADVYSDGVASDSVVVQWDERWTDGGGKSGYLDDEYEGKLLELPYNIKLSEAYAPDVALVEYQGRTAPVKYAGTQRGASLSISCDIEKDDGETVRLLRELAKWPGDAYVRTPNGLGFFADVRVSMSTGFDTALYSVTLACRAVDGEEA